MSGENRRIGLFISVGSTSPRRHLPLFVRAAEPLFKAMDKGVVREFHADTDLSPVQKPRDFRPDAKLRVQYGDVTPTKDKKKAEKAIAGQQPLMQPIGPHDPAYATHAARGKPSEDIHIDAAKHYIQADYHGRHPGGWNQAQEHHKQYMSLRKQGANPTAEHFKTAMQELHPKFTQSMKGLYIRQALCKADPPSHSSRSAVFPLESCKTPAHLVQHAKHHVMGYQTASTTAQKEYHRGELQRHLKAFDAPSKDVARAHGIEHLHDKIMKPMDTRLKRENEDPQQFEKVERIVHGVTTPR